MSAEELYTELKTRILEGDLAAGQSLAEVVLAKQYGVSRLYVKSALQRLLSERLVEHIKNKGYFVLGISEDYWEEVNDIRQALEGVIVRRVIRRGTQEELQGLAKRVSRIGAFVNSGMIEDALEEVGAFYSELYRVSRYERVAAILDTYSGSITILRKRSAETEEENQRSLKEMQALMQAMLDRDEERALGCVESRHSRPGA